MIDKNCDHLWESLCDRDSGFIRWDGKSRFLICVSSTRLLEKARALEKEMAGTSGKVI